MIPLGPPSRDRSRGSGGGVRGSGRGGGRFSVHDRGHGRDRRQFYVKLSIRDVYC